MEMRTLRYFVGTTAAIGLLLTAAGHAWTQGERAADGKTLSGESADTQAMFRNTFGADADREWVTEHNAQIARTAPSVPELPAVPPPPEAPIQPPPPSATTPEMTPTAGGPTATAAITATAAGTPSVIATSGTVVTTPGAASSTSGSPGGAPTAAPPMPTPPSGAQATSNALPQVGVPPTPFPRVNR